MRAGIQLGAAAIMASTLMGTAAPADVIAKWGFSAAVAAPDNNPAPTTGSGTAITLGMDNSYNGGNTASDDVLSSTSAAVASFSEFTWRIRGTTHNGWALHSAGAAQDTQGIELDASTAGFQNIQFSFDWFSTNNAIRDLHFQYNTDVTNARLDHVRRNHRHQHVPGKSQRLLQHAQQPRNIDRSEFHCRREQ